VTANQLRSVSGYTGLMIAPTEDGDTSAVDLRHVAWLFADAFPAIVEIFEFVLAICMEVTESLGVTPEIELDAEVAAGLGFTMEIV
jgi:hypothetical protein